MKKTLPVIILLAGASIAALAGLYLNGRFPKPTIAVGNHRFRIDVAVTPREKERGLSFRKSMDPDQGMLFVFDHSERYMFWMKDMNFPLDFVWIDGGIVADITENVPVPSDSYIPRVQPRVAVDKILELNAGTVKAGGIRIGDTVSVAR